jgi:hypothetical protein
MTNKFKITFELWRDFPSKTEEYKCIEVVNSTDYAPNQTYPKAEVERLCKKANWTVVIRGAK